jgi:signal transduction histidine kinase
MHTIKTRLVLAFAAFVAMTLAMASVLYFGARSLDQNVARTREANAEVRDLLSFALVAHRYVDAFGQSLGQRTLVANNERRVAAKLFESRIGAIPIDRDGFAGSALPWAALRSISEDLDRELRGADVLRANGNFDEAERVFNRARKTHFDQRMLSWFDDAIQRQDTEVDAYETTALRQARMLRVSGGTLALASVFVSALCVLAMMRAFIRPVRLLVNGTHAIAHGDLGHRIAYRGRDELGVLAARFNDMAAVVEKGRGALVEKNAALEEAYRLRGEFLSIVSHELRSPLNSIIGYTELVLEDSLVLPEVACRNVGSIATGARRLLALINDILDFSKLRSGFMQAREQAFEVGDLVVLVVGDARALLLGRPIEVRLDVTEALGEMRSDETKVRQILTNLMSNAVKFTDTGSVTLAVACPTPDAVVFSVRDSGIGIPASQLQLIFEPFRQVRGSERQAVGGTGLGLAIVKRLTRLLGGDVGVHSVVGEGTDFTVTLPRQLARSDEQHPDHR